MGFYDCRCLLTGVSLKGSRAALVLLQPLSVGFGFVPITFYEHVALAVKGSYNRLGSIDNIVENANGQRVLEYFGAALQTGKFVCDEEYLQEHHCFPFQQVSDLLQACERNINEDPSYATLNGEPVVFALISEVVWDAIARSALPTTATAAELFDQLFSKTSPAREIYARDLPPATEIQTFAACNAFMENRGIRWQPAEQDGQHFGPEMREYLAVARLRFADSLAILDALREYESTAGEILLDD